MNELEKHLLQALSSLSEQYKADMTLLEQQVQTLSAQVNDLSSQLDNLGPFLNQISSALKTLGIR